MVQVSHMLTTLMCVQSLVHPWDTVVPCAQKRLYFGKFESRLLISVSSCIESTDRVSVGPCAAGSTLRRRRRRCSSRTRC